MGGSDYASLTQSIAGATTGQVYFFTAEVNLPGGGPYCSVSFQSSNVDSLFSFEYEQSAQNGKVNGSGIFEAPPTDLRMDVNCGDWMDTKVDQKISFDNVQLSVYDPSAGTKPILAVPAEGLVNNDFNSGSLSPWTTDSTTGRMDFAVINGRATVTFTRIVSNFNSPAWIMQRLNRPVERLQKIRIQADVYFNVVGSTTCWASVWAGSPQAWQSGDIRSSQSIHVDEVVTLTSPDFNFYLYSNCQGSGSSNSVAFDNVYLTLNAP